MNSEYQDNYSDAEKEEEQDSSGSKIQFEVSISTDRDQFLRRTCQSCGRDFKTAINPADLAWALSEQIKRMGLDIGAVPAGDEEDVQDQLSCPYCQHIAKASEMHTDETVDYLKRFVYREYMVPMINSTFSDLEDSIAGGQSSGGFLSVSVSLKHDPIPVPPRPIHGPEPPDMKIVNFLCCGEQIKIADAWTEIGMCIYCRSRVALA